jgi:hypothetical protein
MLVPGQVTRFLMCRHGLKIAVTRALNSCARDPQLLLPPLGHGRRRGPSGGQRYVRDWEFSGRRCERTLKSCLPAFIPSMHFYPAYEPGLTLYLHLKIGAPTDFRRVTEPLPVRRRRSFRPLELSIYLPSGRLSPLPDFSTSDWEARIPELPAPARALLRHSSPGGPGGDNDENQNFRIARKPVMSMPAPPTRPFSEPFDLAIEHGTYTRLHPKSIFVSKCQVIGLSTENL